MAKELKNKPLVEAIVELRWELKGQSPGPQTDPHYKLLLGRLFDRLLAEYPEHEQLAAANVPDELVGHVVQHRFRVAKNRWPLVQVGPGILTVNSTSDYRWPDFRPRVLAAVNKLYDAHPKNDELKVTNLILRYIDAVAFDYHSHNALDFMREKMKIHTSLLESFFNDTGVKSTPHKFSLQCAFRCNKPEGTITIRFATGQSQNAPAIVWQTTVESSGNFVPAMPKYFEAWLDEAHDLSDDWFFKTIEGELERRFDDD